MDTRDYPGSAVASAPVSTIEFGSISIQGGAWSATNATPIQDMIDFRKAQLRRYEYQSKRSFQIRGTVEINEPAFKRLTAPRLSDKRRALLLKQFRKRNKHR